MHKVGDIIEFNSCISGRKCRTCDCGSDCTHINRAKEWYRATLLKTYRDDCLILGVIGATGYSRDSVDINVYSWNIRQPIDGRVARMLKDG